MLVQISLWPELPIFDPKNYDTISKKSSCCLINIKVTLCEKLEEPRSDKLHSLGNLGSLKNPEPQRMGKVEFCNS